MTTEHERTRRPRTVLEAELWQRRQTLEEFAEFAENFARQHNEPGTLSVRHLKRLASGRTEGGKPLGPPRAATSRLLERIFGASIDELLSTPDGIRADDDSETELRERLRAAARVDSSVLRLLHEQLTRIRLLDRQLGAVVAHDEVLTKIEQVSRLLHHSLTPATRQSLAALLCELGTLAGWQALDMGRLTEAWQYYEQSTAAARETGSPAFEAHAQAEQAFVLLDLGHTNDAVDVLATTRKRLARRTEPVLRAWLTAAHGEALAADGQRAVSLQAFDHAAVLLPDQPHNHNGPYVALDAVHLSRWRGHALARVGEREAADVLTAALRQLDPTFARAEASLRVDLASAFHARNELDQARAQLGSAAELARDIGSARQRRRIRSLQAALPS